MTIKYLEDVTPYTVIDRPLWWHLKGLQETASGYGTKLTSRRCIQLPNGKTRRIYIWCISNSGVAYVTYQGHQYNLRDTD